MPKLTCWGGRVGRFETSPPTLYFYFTLLLWFLTPSTWGPICAPIGFHQSATYWPGDLGELLGHGQTSICLSLQQQPGSGPPGDGLCQVVQVQVALSAVLASSLRFSFLPVKPPFLRLFTPYKWRRHRFEAISEETRQLGLSRDLLPFL